MQGIVSVESGLDEIKVYLTECGYSVVDMLEAGKVEAVVYSGEACNPGSSVSSGCCELFTVMVNAAGLTPPQVAEALSARLADRNIQDLY